jgi:hypothetical protein
MKHMDVASGAYDHRKGKQEPAAKELDHMRVTPGENGGVSIEHHFTSMEHPPEMHVFGASEGKEAAAHFMKHSRMSEKEESEEHESEY